MKLLPTALIISSLLALPASATSLILPDVLKLTVPTSEQMETSFVRTGPTIQVAILLDSSNSMDGLINQVKEKIWDIVNEISTANKAGKEVTLQVALFEYGKDSISAHEGYVQMLAPLTSDLDLLSDKLFSLKTNGGDEYAGRVILESVNRLSWSKHPDDLKLILIAGNESFNQGNTPVRYSMDKANANNIIVNTVFCGKREAGIKDGWFEGAQMGGGKYLNVNQNESIVHIETPYDSEINKLGLKLNETFIHYGSQGTEKKALQESLDDAITVQSTALMAKRNMSKASKSYDATSWDIVSIFESDKKKAMEIASQSPELEKLSEKEIKTKLNEQKAKREKVESRMSELKRDRASYLAKNKGNDKNDFGSVLIKQIKKQAESKGYSFK